MATEWKVPYSSDLMEIGIDWNYTASATSLTYAPKMYFWYKNNSSDPYVEWTWNLVADGTTVSSGSTTFSTGEFSGTKLIDSFSSRTISRGHSAKTLKLTNSFSDLYGGYNSGTTSSWSGTWTLTVEPLASYTVSYNANGGSGAPSSQTKWHGETLTLSSTKPTKSGYTFLGWSTSSSATSATYSAGGSYTSNSAATLYAIWRKTITISYNANGGSGAPSSQSANVYNGTTSYTFTLSSTKPTKSGYTFLGWSTSSTATSATYSAGGKYSFSSSSTLYAIWSKTITVTYNANGGSGAPSSQSATIYNSTTSYTFTLSSTKPTRTGYTFLGWATSSSATSASYSAGSKQTFSNSVALYAVWSEHYLTINYYSNYATSAFDEALNPVSADTNVLVLTSKYYYDNDYSTYGLADYSTSGGSAYMTRTRYDATGYWCTTTAEDVKLDGNKADVITYDGGIAIGECKSFSSGQAIAQALGLSLASGSQTINLYAHWVLLASRINWYDSDGNVHKGLCHIYDDDGNLHYAIFTVYDENGNAREVI